MRSVASAVVMVADSFETIRNEIPHSPFGVGADFLFIQKSKSSLCLHCMSIIGGLAYG